MSLFGDQGTRERKKADKTGGAAPSAGGAVAYRLTLDLSRAHGLATMLASSRAAQFVEVPDIVAGMYIYEWERLSEYWPEENREDIEGLLREMCMISPQRWNHWIQYYDSKKQKEEPRTRWQKLKKLHKKEGPPEHPPEHSETLRALFHLAGLVSPFRDAADGRDIPVLTMESVLLCIVRNSNSEIAKKLRMTGLDMARLERAALNPKRSPLR